MTQYNMLNVELSNPQLNKLKSGIKNGTEINLDLSWNWLSILMLKVIFHIKYC